MSLVLIELQPTAESDSVRFDLDCVFQAVRFRSGGTRRLSYYVACEGGTVTFETYGTLVRHSQPVPVAVNYEVVEALESGGKISLAPSASAQFGDAKAEVTLPGAEIARNRTSSQKANFFGTEYTIQAFPSSRLVQWDVFPPRVRASVQDFFTGRVPLWASVRWSEGSERKGSAVISPDRVEFYDANRRRLGRVKSVLMWWKLRKMASQTLFKDGCRITFELPDG